MRRSVARHWDADGSVDHRENLSPRSQQQQLLDGEHLLPFIGGGGDDMLGDHTGGGGFGTAGGGCGMEAGIHSASPRAGMMGVGSGGGGGGGGGVGGGGGGASPRDRESGGNTAGGRKRGKGGGRRFFLRIHKFVFQTELALHLSMCILSIAIPFSLSGSPWLAAIPVSVWCFYNAMFVMGAKRASTVLPGFDRFKRSFVAAMEEFLPPRLAPVLSLSFLSVVIAVTLTAARLGGPPLCISSCSTCLGSWKHAHPVVPLHVSAVAGPTYGQAVASRSRMSPKIAGAFDRAKTVGDHVHGGGGAQAGSTEQGRGVGEYDRFQDVVNAATQNGSPEAKNGEACGYANGKELLAYYTVSQSAILIYLAVMTGLLTCLAWKVSEEELAQRQAAEGRLKAQNPQAFDLRERMILEHGRPGSSVRPETTCPWLMFGLVAACTFTLIGWRKWGDLPLTAVTVVVVMANVTTTLASVLMLHVGFHGRLIALYQGNLQRVRFLSKLLREGTSKAEEPWVLAAEAWWFLRSFVLREDLSLDYDVGGLGVSATFFIVLVSFVVAIAQIVREGLDAMLNPPGSYCAYASVYLTVCLIRIFGLANKTYLEQQLHVGIIQEYMDTLHVVANKMASFSSGSREEGRGQPLPSTTSLAGTPAITCRVCCPSTAVTTGAGAATMAAASPRNLRQSQQRASVVPLVAVTGTSDLQAGAGTLLDRVDAHSGGAEVVGGSSSGGGGGGGGGGGSCDEGGVEEGERQALNGDGDVRRRGSGGGSYPAQDAMRRMIVHISTLDPYPCVLGIPVKPALFATSKVYVFLCFSVISVKLMYDVVTGAM